MTAVASEVKVRAIAPWFGGKRNIADEIIAELGPHRVYWEPFCGSMAVLLAKPDCVMETVNDLHGDLVNLARVIQHPAEGPRLYRRLRRTLMVERLFEESAEVIRASEFSPEGALDTDRAYHYCLTTWLGRNGVAGTSNYNHHFCVRYTANGGNAAKRWDSVTASIPAWRRRLRNVTILGRDAFEVLPRIEDRAGTAIYVDPPYLMTTRSPNAGMGRKAGSGNYRHEFRGDDHVRLAAELCRFRESRVVVSYYDDPQLGDLYPGWTKRLIEVTKAMVNQGSRGKKDARAIEALLTNGPSYVQPNGARGLFDH